jgi:hypothetical protein
MIAVLPEGDPECAGTQVAMHECPQHLRTGEPHRMSVRVYLLVLTPS